MIKVEPMSALKNADFILDMLSELRLNGVVKMSMVTNAGQRSRGSAVS
jgi:hypothetical protein